MTDHNLRGPAPRMIVGTQRKKKPPQYITIHDYAAFDLINNVPDLDKNHDLTYCKKKT